MLQNCCVVHIFDNMKQIKIQLEGANPKTYSMPEGYHELDFQQLIFVSFYYSDHLHKISVSDIRAIKMALFPMLTMPKMNFQVYKEIHAYQWVELLSLLDWVFETPKFNKWPLPYLSPEHKHLKSPVEMMRTSSIYEVSTMEDIFTLVANAKMTVRMKDLICLLFRPERSDIKKFRKSNEWNGDVREPFNLITYKDRSAVYEKSFASTKSTKTLETAVFLFVTSFHEHNLMKGFANLFEKPTDKTEGNSYGWPGIILEMSNTKFGSLEDTQKQNWYTVLFEMSRQVDLKKQRDAAIEKTKRKNL